MDLHEIFRIIDKNLIHECPVCYDDFTRYDKWAEIEKALQVLQFHGQRQKKKSRGLGYSPDIDCRECGTGKKKIQEPVTIDGIDLWYACPNCRPDLFSPMPGATPTLHMG